MKSALVRDVLDSFITFYFWDLLLILCVHFIFEMNGRSFLFCPQLFINDDIDDAEDKFGIKRKKTS